jgi:hypothetical protein
MEEISNMSGKGLVSRIYKGLLQLNSKNKNKKNPIFKWAKDLNRHLSKEIYLKNAKKYMKSSTSFI